MSSDGRDLPFIGEERHVVRDRFVIQNHLLGSSVVLKVIRNKDSLVSPPKLPYVGPFSTFN